MVAKGSKDRPVDVEGTLLSFAEVTDGCVIACPAGGSLFQESRTTGGPSSTVKSASGRSYVGYWSTTINDRDIGQRRMGPPMLHNHLQQHLAVCLQMLATFGTSSEVIPL